MTTTSFRTDAELEAAIAVLVGASNTARSRSEVIRRAILDAARQVERDALRSEAEAMLADPEIVAETMAAAEAMAAHRAW